MHKKRSPARSYSTRKVNTREVRKRFLIICEGTKTEPNYFESFCIPTVKIEGVGENPSRLVAKAKERKKQAEKDNEAYEQIWCVFDRNSWPPEDFNNAISNAKSQEFGIAYSNEAFELWYILHFEFLNTGIPRNDYIQKLTNLLQHPYEKNSETIYEDLLSKQKTAIKNAENLLSKYNPPDPAKDNPSTTVHLLVKELNKLIP